MQLAPGDTFGRYVIEGPLGTGGGGQVYRARDTVLRRAVALKILQAEGGDGLRTEGRARILREATAAAALDHPNAVAIFDVGEVGETPYLAMECISGRSLRTYIGDKTVPLESRIRWLVDIALALAAAHARGLVHRDVKPENVMVRDDGFIKVVDFGIARAVALDPTGPTMEDSVPTSVSGRGGIAGTPQYMAPEQIRAAPLDGRADQFSWGILAYELLADGALPWDAGRGMLGYVAHVLGDDPVSLRERDARISPEVAAVVERALRRSPADRFASMSDIASALDPHQRHSSRDVAGSSGADEEIGYLTTRSAAIVSSHRIGPSPRSRRRVVASVALVLAMVAGLVAVVEMRATRHLTLPLLASAAEPNGPSSHARVKVQAIVLSFDNQAPEPLLDGTLDVMMALALARSPLIFSYYGSDLSVLASELGQDRVDQSLARALAARDGQPVVTVRGTVVLKNPNYSLSVDATDPTGAVLVSRTLQLTDVAQVVPAMGRLACEIRAKVADVCPPEAMDQTGMSSSLEADHEFALARRAWAILRAHEAVEHLTRAVAIDPEFVKAHLGLGLTLWNVGRRADAEAQFKLVSKWADRMTENERLRFFGDYYGTIGENSRAIAAYEEYVRQWPQDAAVTANLSLTYAQDRQFARGLEVARALVKAHPSLRTRTNLPPLLLFTGDFEGASREADGLLRDFPNGGENAFAYAGVTRVLLGHAQDSVEFYGKLKAVDPSRAALNLADLAVYQGRLNDAAALLEIGIAADTSTSEGTAAAKWAMLAQARLAKGDKAGAALAADQAVAAGDETTKFEAGAVYMEAGLAKKGLAVAESLSSSLAGDPRIFAKLLQAEAARVSGRARDAVKLIEDAQHMGDSWLGRFYLGKAYLDLGVFAEAENEFATCIKRRGEGSIVFLDDIPTLRFVAPAYYYLARSEDGLGSAEAVASYETFLGIRASAQNDLLTEDARHRLGSR